MLERRERDVQREELTAKLEAVSIRTCDWFAPAL